MKPVTRERAKVHRVAGPWRTRQSVEAAYGFRRAAADDIENRGLQLPAFAAGCAHSPAPVGPGAEGSRR